MALGLVLGGVADGITQGIKNNRERDEQREARDKRERDARVRGLYAAMPTKLPGNTTIDDYAAQTDAGLQTKKPAAGLKGLGAAVLTRLRPQEAAQAAGLPTMPAQAGAPGGAPGMPGAGQPMPAPAADEVGGIDVRLPRERDVTPLENARYMAYVARKSGDPAAVTNAMTNVINLEKVENTKALASASMRGPGGIANLIEKVMPNTTVDFEPTDKEGVYKFSIDGQEAFTGDMDTAVSRVQGFLDANPMAHLDFAAKRDERDLNRRNVESQIGYRASQQETAQREQVTREKLAAASIAKDAAATEAAKLELEDLKAEKSDLNAYVDLTQQDPLLSRDARRSAASRVSARNPVKYKKERPLRDNQGTVVGTESVDSLLENEDKEYEDALARFKASEFTTQQAKAGGYGIELVPVTLRDGSTIQVYQIGPNEVFERSLDAAERTARRMRGR